MIDPQSEKSPTFFKNYLYINLDYKLRFSLNLVQVCFTANAP